MTRVETAGGETGFSLIELLIVIVILGVLVGIVVLGIGTFWSDSEAAACEADQKTVAAAKAAYDARHGDGTATLANIVSAGYLEPLTPDTCVTS